MQASFISLKKIVHLSVLSVIALLLNACGSYPQTTFEDSNTSYNTQNTTQSQEVAKYSHLVTVITNNILIQKQRLTVPLNKVTYLQILTPTPLLEA